METLMIVAIIAATATAAYIFGHSNGYHAGVEDSLSAGLGTKSDLSQDEWRMLL